MALGGKMTVGDLVKHWTEDIGLGIVVEIDECSWKIFDTNHKVVWPDGDWGWYRTDRLQKVTKCK